MKNFVKAMFPRVIKEYEEEIERLSDPNSPLLVELRNQESAMKEKVNFLDTELLDKQKLYDEVADKAKKEALIEIQDLLEQNNKLLEELESVHIKPLQ